MPVSTLPNPCWTSSIRSSVCLLVILAIGTTGCRIRSKSAVDFSRGYVRMDALERLHPGWADVKQIDGLIQAAKQPPILPASQSIPFTAINLPPPLSAQAAPKRAGPEAEAAKIEAIRG